MDLRPTLAVVVGVRPQYIKLAPLQRAARRSTSVRWVYVDVGQHYDTGLAGRYHDEYALDFDHSLQVARAGDRPGEVLSRMRLVCGDGLGEISPTGCVVMGDANVSLAATDAAARLGIPVAHVEAGEREGARGREEENRRRIDRRSVLHLASSRTDFRTLVACGRSTTTRFAGDLLVDVCAEHRPRPDRRIDDAADDPAYGFADGFADEDPADCSVVPDRLVLALHHQETLADPAVLRRIVEQVAALGLQVVHLLHPRTRQALCDAGISLPGDWETHESLGHADVLRLIRASRLVVTDSGGLQRECVYLGRRAVVVQKYPFWPSLVALGANVAVPPDGDLCAAAAEAMTSWDGVVDEFGGPDVAGTTVGLLEEWASRGCR